SLPPVGRQYPQRGAERRVPGRAARGAGDGAADLDGGANRAAQARQTDHRGRVPMTARRPPISLHIERLVLEDLPLTPAHAAHIRSGRERELARVMAEDGDVEAWTAGAVRAAPPAPTAAPAMQWDATRPHQLGRTLAGNVFASLTGRSPQPPGPRGRS